MAWFIFSNISAILDTELIFLFSPRTGLSSLGLVCTMAGLTGSVLSGLPGLGLVCRYFIIDEWFSAVVILFVPCFILISGIVVMFCTFWGW